MEKPIEKNDGLELENLRLRVLVDGLRAELMAIKLPMAHQESLRRYNEALESAQTKYKTKGWELDFDRMVWKK